MPRFAALCWERGRGPVQRKRARRSASSTVHLVMVMRINPNSVSIAALQQQPRTKGGGFVDTAAQGKALVNEDPRTVGGALAQLQARRLQEMAGIPLESNRAVDDARATLATGLEMALRVRTRSQGRGGEGTDGKATDDVRQETKPLPAKFSRGLAAYRRVMDDAASDGNDAAADRDARRGPRR